MKHWNRLFLIGVAALLALVLFFGASFGWYYFFIFPVLVISLFLGMYLYKQSQKNQEEQLKKRAKFAKEDVEAEKWVESTFAPHVLSFIKVKLWLLIIYSFFFVAITSFLWSYLSFGYGQAVKNLSYTVVMFVLFLSYVLIFPAIFSFFERLLPKNWRMLPLGNWAQAYVFLFPVSFLFYLLFPFDTIASDLINKISSLPLFFVVYSFSFLVLYSMIYFYEQIRAEDQKNLEDNLQKLLAEKESKKF